MPPVPARADAFPSTIYGIHDLEGASFLTQNQCSGWLVHSVRVGSDPPADLTPYLSQGLRVIVRLNQDTRGTGNGTIPLPAGYDAFAAQCANWVAHSRGAQIWVIGNEMNHPLEYPKGQPITPQLYASAFVQVRAAIHAQPGHAQDQVIPGAVAPWNAAQGDWVQYFRMLLTLLDGNLDGIALHTYTHGAAAEQAGDEAKFSAPFGQLHYNLRTYRDFLNAVPYELRRIPVYITETGTVMDAGPAWTHQATGWVQAAYSEINTWNQAAGNQPIQALILYRWRAEGRPEISIANFTEILADFRAAISLEYKLPVTRSVGGPALSLEQAVLAASKTKPWMPVNNQAALWRFAQARGLQDQQTDELLCKYNGESYIVQVFNKGIVYVKSGDWANIKVIPK